MGEKVDDEEDVAVRAEGAAVRVVDLSALGPHLDCGRARWAGEASGRERRRVESETSGREGREWERAIGRASRGSERRWKAAEGKGWEGRDSEVESARGARGGGSQSGSTAPARTKEGERDARNKTSVRSLESTMAYVRSRRVFSSARRFSKPMSHATPAGQAGVAGIVSLMMGIRARGSILT